jgi:hypothetical protein
LLSQSRFVRAAQAGAVLAVVLGLGLASPAEARNPEDVFRGQIITSSKRIPTKASSKAAYISQLKRQKTGRFYENKSTKSWKVYYTAFFKKPLNSLEVTVKIYELSGSGKRMLASFEQYMDKRGARSITSNVTLNRDDFGVNKNLMMTVESNGSVLSAARFAIIGEAEKYSGQVNFSEEEASKGTDD